MPSTPTTTQILRDEHKEIMGLREEVHKDITLAIANFKVWLLVTVLSNVILVGAPAFYVFVSTSSVAEAAFRTGTTNAARLDRQRGVLIDHEARLADVEKELAERYNYQRRPQLAPTEM